MTATVWHTGDTEEIQITVTDGGVNVSSLAGTSAEWALYWRGAEVLAKTNDDFTASAPTFTCELAATDLDGLITGTYLAEARVTDASGDTQSTTADVQIVAVAL